MPNRIIKESIRTSKSVNTMTDFQFRLWTYLITYVDDYGRGIADPEILKGFVFPRRKGVTETTIAKALTDLANIGSILLYEVDGESYLCFPNWSEHQAIRNKKSKFPAPDCNLQTIERNCKQLNANVPVIQSNPNPESESISKSESNARDAFAVFWEAYPKKVGKKDAEKAFRKAEMPLDILLTAIEAQKNGEQWQKENGRFIPNPATWLNQGRWDDEVISHKSGNVFLELAEEGVFCD
ncbi:MAG: hypothetical protein ACOX7K_08685 [Oscillospiraceae bacterium]|jgi:hypothetical protein